MWNVTSAMRKYSVSRGGRNSKTNVLKKSQTPQQLSLEEAEDRVCPRSVNDPRSQRVTRCLVKIVALDCQLFSIGC